MTAATPALATARRGTSIVLVTNDASCSPQFNPIGTARFTSPCDIARRVPAANAANYAFTNHPATSSAQVRVGSAEIAVPSFAG